MGKRSAAMVLAENLKRLMEMHPQLKTAGRVGVKSGIAQKTINNIEKARFDPKLSTIEAIAKAFGLEPFQLLCPSDDRNLLTICRSYANADARGRAFLTLAAKAMIDEKDGSATTAISGAPAPRTPDT